MFLVTKLAINPSSQMHNAGVAPGYIEGEAMRHMGVSMHDDLERMGVEADVFWSGRGDRIAGLKEEVYKANTYGADYFISLHSDSAGARNGVMVVYYYSDAGYWLGRKVAAPVCKELGLVLRLEGNSSFYVLKATKMPAVLIETLNHSSAIDCAKLDSKQFREKMASLFAIAYAKYIGHVAPVPAKTPTVVKEKEANMQFGRKHRLLVLREDRLLHVSNVDDDDNLRVVRRQYNSTGRRVINTVDTIGPHKTWTMKLDGFYGLITLSSLGRFVSRVE